MTVIRNLILVLALSLGIGVGSASASDAGNWEVDSAAGGYELTWTSPEALPLTSDRPTVLVDGVEAGPAAVSPDGREVSATVEGEEAPDPAELEIWLSGRRLDLAEPEPLTLAGPTWNPSAGNLEELGFDPGRKGPYPIRTDDYTAPGWKFAGMRRKLETKGHVVAPSDPDVAAGAPLVLFLHGRHESCFRTFPKRRTAAGWPCPKGTKPIPSDLGYDYLQRVLASQGFVTVSIAANGINAQDGALADGGANARAEAVRRHLDLWSGWVSRGKRRADLSRVILVGHSRGGEGVNRAAESIPDSAPYRVVGQVLLAPTDFARQSAAYIPTVTVLPYCDGDVSDLQGQIYTDNSIGLSAGDDSLKSSVIMFGANHNFFNTEWTPGVSKAPSFDDSWAPPKSLCGSKGKTRLSAAQQRRVGTSYVAGAVRLMTGIDDRDLALFDGSAVRVGPVRTASVISHSVGGGKTTLVAGRQARLAAGRQAGMFTCRGYAGAGKLSCAKDADYDAAPHWPFVFTPGLPTRPALAMEWNRGGRTARLGLDRELDLSGMDSLDLRVVVDPFTRVARIGVKLTDATGNEIELTPVAGGRVDGMPYGLGTTARWLARSVRVPLPSDGLASFDPRHVTAVSIVGKAKPACGAGCPKASGIRLLDISARPEVPVLATPSGRLPTLRTRSVKRPEGGPGVHEVRVPFRISGEVTDPGARFRVVTGDVREFGKTKATTVSLAPNQKTGSIVVRYRGDAAYARDRRIRVDVYPVRGIIPVTAASVVTLVNDDRKPKLVVRPLNRTIRAGSPLRWRVRLDGPIAEPAAITAGFSPVPDLPDLRLGDLAPGWFDRYAFGPGTDELSDDTPLSRTRVRIRGAGTLFRGPRVITIPTRGFSGPARGVRLELNVRGIGRALTPTIRVLPD